MKARDLQPGQRFALVTEDRSHGLTYEPYYEWERLEGEEARWIGGMRLPCIPAAARFGQQPRPIAWFVAYDRVHLLAAPPSEAGTDGAPETETP